MGLVRALSDLDATHRLGAEIALLLRPGDVVCLSGPIGAGKTELVRSIIGALADECGLDVPSPTYTLVQSYDTLRIPVTHADLYRLDCPEELSELGLDEALGDGAVLLEWPDRAGGWLPEDRLDIELETLPSGSRTATMRGRGTWQDRLARADRLASFIDRARWADAERRWLQGDASTRTYEHLARDGGSRRVLMNAPKGPDGPPVRHGKPYSQIAHLAEDIGAFVAVALHLRALGLSPPQLYDFDLADGFILMEHLGTELYGTMIADRADMREPYLAAASVLATLHAQEPPGDLALPGAASHRLPRYEAGTYLIETELLVDWTWPERRGEPCPDSARAAFTAAWRRVLETLTGPAVLTLRDFHSPNLLWLPGRAGAARAGLLDFQDALVGHPAYDLASLVQDARISLPSGLGDMTIDAYWTARPSRLKTMSRSELDAAVAILGAQRATKIIGIFDRLARRDGKPDYRQHIPRVAGYLARDLEHPVLRPVADWFSRHLPDFAPAAAPTGLPGE